LNSKVPVSDFRSLVVFPSTCRNALIWAVGTNDPNVRMPANARSPTQPRIIIASHPSTSAHERHMRCTTASLSSLRTPSSVFSRSSTSCRKPSRRRLPRGKRASPNERSWCNERSSSPCVRGDSSELRALSSSRSTRLETNNEYAVRMNSIAKWRTVWQGKPVCEP